MSLWSCELYSWRCYENVERVYPHVRYWIYDTFKKQPFIKCEPAQLASYYAVEDEPIG